MYMCLMYLLKDIFLGYQYVCVTCNISWPESMRIIEEMKD